jgi:phosphate transport system substrate-binding protein
MTVTLPRRAGRLATAAVATLGSVGATCSGSHSHGTSPTTGRPTPTSGAPVLAAASLKGTGSPFQRAFDQAAIRAFTSQYPDIAIMYTVAPPGATSQLAARAVDFAGSDTPISDYGPYGGSDALLYFPTVAAPVAVAYNAPGVTRLTLSPGTLARIFSGKVAAWNDPAIAADNPGLALPSTRLTPVHLSDPSGTTRTFTLYLAKAAPVDWALGTGTTISWPTGTAAPASPAAAQVVKATPGAIGYVELPDAQARQVTVASVRNAAGRAVDPTLPGVSAALSGALVNANLTYDPTDAPGLDAYPIASPTWIVVFKNQPDKAKGAALKTFLTYLLTEGQVTLTRDTGVAPLSPNILQPARAQLNRIVVAA